MEHVSVAMLKKQGGYNNGEKEKTEYCRKEEK